MGLGMGARSANLQCLTVMIQCISVALSVSRTSLYSFSFKPYNDLRGEVKEAMVSSSEEREETQDPEGKCLPPR